MTFDAEYQKNEPFVGLVDIVPHLRGGSYFAKTHAVKNGKSGQWIQDPRGLRNWNGGRTSRHSWHTLGRHSVDVDPQIRCSCDQFFHLTSTVLPHYLAKFVNSKKTPLMRLKSMRFK